MQNIFLKKTKSENIANENNKKNISLDILPFNQKNNQVSDKANSLLKALIGKNIPKFASSFPKKINNKFDSSSICTSLQIANMISPKNPSELIQLDYEKIELDNEKINNVELTNKSNRRKLSSLSKSKNFLENEKKSNQFPLKKHQSSTNKSSKLINNIFENEK